MFLMMQNLVMWKSNNNFRKEFFDMERECEPRQEMDMAVFYVLRIINTHMQNSFSIA